jgi:hypothetical protein
MIMPREAKLNFELSVTHLLHPVVPCMTPITNHNSGWNWGKFVERGVVSPFEQTKMEHENMRFTLW